jgi:hypothetical protein
MGPFRAMVCHLLPPITFPSHSPLWGYKRTATLEVCPDHTKHNLEVAALFSHTHFSQRNLRLAPHPHTHPLITTIASRSRSRLCSSQEQVRLACLSRFPILTSHRNILKSHFSSDHPLPLNEMAALKVIISSSITVQAKAKVRLQAPLFARAHSWPGRLPHRNRSQPCRILPGCHRYQTVRLDDNCADG